MLDRGDLPDTEDIECRQHYGVLFMSTENLSTVLTDELSSQDREQGYVKDESGLTNKFAVEPEPYAAEPGERPEDFFGFTPFAETLSGRIAMIGFDLLVLTEILTGKGITHLWG